MPWIMWLSSRFILLLVERKWDSKSLSGNLWSQELRVSFPCNFMIIYLIKPHPRRPRGSQSGEEKRRDESFQARAEEPLGTYSHRTISIRSSEYWLLIGHKKCFVLLCPIGEQFHLSPFREFVQDGYYLATVARFVHQAFLTRQRNYRWVDVSDAINRSNSICTEKIHFLRITMYRK